MKNKIMCLIPCLMQENNRSANLKAIEQKKSFDFDEIVICNQNFDETDYKKDYTYINDENKKLGFVGSRNLLLEHFYKSDFDYAIWFDANEVVTNSSVNDLNTLIYSIKNDDVAPSVDVIFSTLGIIINTKRMLVKKCVEHLEYIFLLPEPKTMSPWFHGMVMKNFKKYYNHEFYCDKDCDPNKGLCEDVYFARLLNSSLNCYTCPTITISKPSNKTSTWVSDKEGYDYPENRYSVIDSMVEKSKFVCNKQTTTEYKFKRIDDDWKQFVSPFKERKKKDDDVSKIREAKLF